MISGNLKTRAKTFLKKVGSEPGRTPSTHIGLLAGVDLHLCRRMIFLRYHFVYTDLYLKEVNRENFEN